MTAIQAETKHEATPLSASSPPDYDQNQLSEQNEILEFWFGPTDNQSSSYLERRSLWFGKDQSFDHNIYEQFSSVYDKVASGECKAWQHTPEGCLALVLVMDQFPRNMFRGDAKSFATDLQALKVTQRAIAQGFDRELLPVQRLFVYLPLEHSESRDHQQQAVTLFQALADEHQEFNDTYVYALKHQAVIERFGRFPHRNDILDRPSTPEEIEFLKQPGSSF